MKREEMLVDGAPDGVLFGRVDGLGDRVSRSILEREACDFHPTLSIFRIAESRVILIQLDQTRGSARMFGKRNKVRDSHGRYNSLCLVPDVGCGPLGAGWV